MVPGYLVEVGNEPTPPLAVLLEQAWLRPLEGIDGLGYADSAKIIKFVKVVKFVKNGILCKSCKVRKVGQVALQPEGQSPDSVNYKLL